MAKSFIDTIIRNTHKGEGIHTVLKLNHLSFALLVTSQLKVFGTLDGNLVLPLADGAFQTQYQLFGGFGL